MSWSHTWLAVRCEQPESLFALAAVRPTDQSDEYFHAAVSGAQLPGDWFVLAGRGCDHRLVQPDSLATISARWPCVALSVEDHVMVSWAAEWRDGVEVWHVLHDGQEGILHLDSRGTLPVSFRELHESTLREQQEEGGEDAEVDLLFDVPGRLVTGITGFAYEETDAPFVAFVDDAPRSRKRWWKALLGKA